METSFVICLGQVISFATLLSDAWTMRAKHISPQLCVGRAIAFMLMLSNLPYDAAARLRLLVGIGLGLLLITVATWKIVKHSELQGEDDLFFGSSPAVAKVLPYGAAISLSTIALVVACHFSIDETLAFAQSEPRAVTCTLNNFLNVTSLVPQLVLTHRLGRVSPAAVRFFIVCGLTHIYEFAVDAHVSIANYYDGTFSIHELSFMSGDFLSAIFLLDFLFMVVTSGDGFCSHTGLYLPQSNDADGSPRKAPNWLGLKALFPYLPPSFARSLCDVLNVFSNVVLPLGDLKLSLCTVRAAAAGKSDEHNV